MSFSESLSDCSFYIFASAPVESLINAYLDHCSKLLTDLPASVSLSDAVSTELLELLVEQSRECHSPPQRAPRAPCCWGGGNGIQRPPSESILPCSSS